MHGVCQHENRFGLFCFDVTLKDNLKIDTPIYVGPIFFKKVVLQIYHPIKKFFNTKAKTKWIISEMHLHPI